MEKTTRVKQSRSKYIGVIEQPPHVHQPEMTVSTDSDFDSMLTTEWGHRFADNKRQQERDAANPAGQQRARRESPMSGGYQQPVRTAGYKNPPAETMYRSQQPESDGTRDSLFRTAERRQPPVSTEYGRVRQKPESTRYGQGYRQSESTEYQKGHRQSAAPVSRPVQSESVSIRRAPSRNGHRQPYPSSGSAPRRQTPAKTVKRQRDNLDFREPNKEQPARKKTGSNFIVQGSILAAAGIIVRLIGMFYRIPLANYIGDEGNGYYSAAYNIYSILLILSSYSMPVAVSKMVSARLAKKQNRNSLRILKAALFYATVAGGLGFCVLWFGSDFFASHIIKMPFSAYALRVLAPTIWIMAYLGVLRGFFQGHSTMVPTAVSQIFEQIVNAVVSLLAARTLFEVGVRSNLVYKSTEYSYAFGAAGGALGTGAGALTALLLFVVLLFLRLPAMRRRARREPISQVESYGTITSILFFTVVPIIISSTLYNSSTVIDNTLFGQVMSSLGQENEIASQWGIYSGKYHLLFNIPVAVANSLSSSLIPSLSRAVAERNRRQILERISNAIRFSMIIAIPSAVGLTVLAAPVCNLLFSGGDNEMLIRMTLLGSSAVVVYSLSTVTNAVLQGINRMNVPIKNAAISMVLHGIILYVMLRIFKLGIYGVLYSNILFALFICILNARAISRYKRYRQEIVKTFLIPMAASAAMGASAYGIYRLCSLKMGNIISTLISILVAVMVYFVLLIKLKGIDAREMKSFPGGTRLLTVARKLHLM